MPSSNFFPMDGTDNARIVIDTTHHEVHKGDLHEFHFEALAVASGITTILHIKTGTKQLHTFLEFGALGGLLKINIYDSATVGTAGSAIACPNLNQNFADTFSGGTLVYSGSTVGTVGTAIATKTILATATAPSKTNSAVKEFAERVWEPNKNYIIALLTGAASMAFTVDGVIGEHD